MLGDPAARPGLVARVEARAIEPGVVNRDLFARQADGYAQLAAEAEQTAAQLELDATARLTPAERKTLIRLLQKVYD